MKRGFTLFEMLVAVGLFSVVAVTSAASLMALISAQKKAVFVQTNQDNVRFAIESISREIRTGQMYRQDGYCAGVTTPMACFQFQNALGEDVIVKLAETPADRLLCGSATAVCVLKSSNGGVLFEPVTAPEVSIQHLRFHTTGMPAGDRLQPKVTIILWARTPNADPRQSDLNVQTTISQLGLQN